MERLSRSTLKPKAESKWSDLSLFRVFWVDFDEVQGYSAGQKRKSWAGGASVDKIVLIQGVKRLGKISRIEETPFGTY
jgi:hypothetical protein